MFTQELPQTVLQTYPSSDRTLRYNMIETKPFLDLFQFKGFQVQTIKCATTRKEQWLGHEKHRITLAHPDFSGNIGSPTIQLINSSNGSSQFELLLGFLTKVCSNGATLSREHWHYQVRHIGKNNLDITQLTDSIFQGFEVVSSQVNKMHSKTLPIYDQWKMAEYAIGLKWENKDIPFPISSMLKGYRLEQEDSTVWNIYNRVQENLIRGFEYQSGKRTRKTRAVKSVNADTTLNQKLWDYALSLA